MACLPDSEVNCALSTFHSAYRGSSCGLKFLPVPSLWSLALPQKYMFPRSLNAALLYEEAVIRLIGSLNMDGFGDTNSNSCG